MKRRRGDGAPQMAYLFDEWTRLLSLSNPTMSCYFRRNEQVIGSKIAINRQPGAVTVVGDDPKKFAAAMVEYSRDKVRATFHNLLILKVILFTTFSCKKVN